MSEEKKDSFDHRRVSSVQSALDSLSQTRKPGAAPRIAPRIAPRRSKTKKRKQTTRENDDIISSHTDIISTPSTTPIEEKVHTESTQLKSTSSKVIESNKKKKTVSKTAVFSQALPKKTTHRMKYKKKGKAEDTALLPRTARTLLDLVHDSTSGTPSNSFLEKIKRDKEAKETKRLADAAAPSRTAVVQVEEKESELPSAIPLEEEKAATVVPQVQLINGQIVVNEQSLTVMQPEEKSVVLDIVHETRQRITSASYSTRNTTERWNLVDTKKFYKALSQYGTDFSFISQLFPHRNRRQVKAKFKKEEKLHHRLINMALSHHLPIDEESFERVFNENLTQ